MVIKFFHNSKILHFLGVKSEFYHSTSDTQSYRYGEVKPPIDSGFGNQGSEGDPEWSSSVSAFPVKPTLRPIVMAIVTNAIIPIPHLLLKPRLPEHYHRYGSISYETKIVKENEFRRGAADKVSTSCRQRSPDPLLISLPNIDFFTVTSSETPTEELYLNYLNSLRSPYVPWYFEFY